MDRTDFLTALQRDGDAFAAACSSVGLDADVASCPHWKLGDLVWHLTAVHTFWRTMTAGLLQGYESYAPPTRPADGDLVATYAAGLAATVDVLSEADPTATMWTWSHDRTPGFVIRRMAHETAVHSWDACDAAGSPTPIEAVLASDGIDEFLEYFTGDVAEGAATVAGSVHIHCTDVAGEWTVREGADGFITTREHAKGDCALRGAASDLLLVLWRRFPISAIGVVGDADVAARFVAHSALS